MSYFFQQMQARVRRLAKHGDHDQSSHGNRDGGGGGEGGGKGYGGEQMWAGEPIGSAKEIVAGYSYGLKGGPSEEKAVAAVDKLVGSLKPDVEGGAASTVAYYLQTLSDGNGFHDSSQMLRGGGASFEDMEALAVITGHSLGDKDEYEEEAKNLGYT